MTDSELSPLPGPTRVDGSMRQARQLFVAVESELPSTGSTGSTTSGSASLASTRDWVRTGTTLLEGLLPEAQPAWLQGKSRLEGWSRAHVLAHLARNADALCNLLTWAKTGVPTQMYNDLQARGSDIERSAAVPPQTLLDDFKDSARRLMGQINGLSQQDWSHPVESALGRSILASEVPWLRSREIWLHAVDLDLGMDLEDLPPTLTSALISDIVQNLSSKLGCPSALLCAGGSTWTLGPEAHSSDSAFVHNRSSGVHDDHIWSDDQTLVISGEPAALLGWLSGRVIDPNPSGTPVPAIPRWI